jgi:hypothetical protein
MRLDPELGCWGQLSSWYTKFCVAIEIASTDLHHWPKINEPVFGPQGSRFASHVHTSHVRCSLKRTEKHTFTSRLVVFVREAG